MVLGKKIKSSHIVLNWKTYNEDILEGMLERCGNLVLNHINSNQV